MKIIRHDHMVSIQRGIALATFILLVIQLIVNITSAEYNAIYWFNLFYTSFLLIAFTSSYFIDHIFFRGTQAVLTILTGIILNISRHHETLILSDVLIVIGILLLYMYRIIKDYKPLTVIIVTVVILILKVTFTAIMQKGFETADLLNTTFYVTIIGTFLFVFSTDIMWYTMRSYLLEKYMRVGMNAANLVHEQNLEVITSHIDFAVETIQEGDGET